MKHLTVGILVIGTLIPSVFARHPKITKDLDTSKIDSTDVIVQFAETPTARNHDKFRKKGGRLKLELSAAKSAVYSIAASELEELANDPKVVFITPDREVYAMDAHTDSATGASVARTNGWTGTGIGVAVIDSGVSSAPDLSTRIVYSQSFVPQKADEVYGHGTHVAGIIVGTGKDSKRDYLGIAPDANIVNLRVLDDNGSGTDSAVIAAIDRAIALKQQYNIRVMNLSLGRQVKESYILDPLCQAVERAWKAGIVVVVAAGNLGRRTDLGTDGYATIHSPGNDPYVITVGAMKTMGTLGVGDDQIASYSSKGPTIRDRIVKPDLVAPGNRIISVSTKGTSLLEKSFSRNKVGTAYFNMSGTSMATPVVSGAAVLLLQKTPTLTPNQVKARLMKSARKQFPSVSTWTDASTGTTYRSYYDIFTVGAGYLDIPAALANTSLTITSAPLSPSVVYDAVTQKVRMVNGSSLVWGDSLVWGESLVWGSSLVWGDSLIWGDSLVWGDRTTSGFSLVWGDFLSWGGSPVLAESRGILIEGDQ